MEKDMSETNHTSRLATLEEHDTIEDTELDAVTGGNAVNGAVTGALAQQFGFMARGICNSNGPTDELPALGPRIELL
jgi:hypothetical protein